MVNWMGPMPPAPPLSRGPGYERRIKEYFGRNRAYFKKEQEYWDHVHYWDRWFIKLYRWWMIKVYGKDPKPYFDINY